MFAEQALSRSGSTTALGLFTREQGARGTTSAAHMFLLQHSTVEVFCLRCTGVTYSVS